MASVDKVRIGTNTYDVSPSGAGTLKSEDFTSGDSSTATSWQSVNPITTSDTNASIFSKVTTMVRNIRYLYNKLGTTDFSSAGSTVSGALKNLQDNKASSSHSHTTSELPISSSQVNSSAYIPTSSLVYSMNQTLTSLNDASNLGFDFTTNVDCGGIVAGTELHSTDTLQNTVKNMLHASLPPTPSTEYESRSLGSWSSMNDVDNFFISHNVQNGFDGIKIGNYVTINDCVYNVDWEVAGFNLEHNNVASDSTTYDNGYGILMIPKISVVSARWSPSTNTPYSYIESEIHNMVLPGVANNLKNVLSNHIINRSVLLGSKCEGTTPRKWTTSAYTWTKSYLTLMSVGQLTGTFASHTNVYDDGEANYKLPLFEYEDYKTESRFRLRNVYGYSDSYFHIYGVDKSAGIRNYGYATMDVRPLMLLR